MYRAHRQWLDKTRSRRFGDVFQRRRQREILRKGRNCFNCLGDLAVCGGARRCTAAPASRASGDLLKALKTVDADPQALALDLLGEQAIDGELEATEGFEQAMMEVCHALGAPILDYDVRQSPADEVGDINHL